MIEFLGLPKLGQMIRAVDRHLVEVIAQRKKLALQVGVEKQISGGHIVREFIESGRLEEAQAWAKQKGLNPHFMHALLYMIIDESCKVQTEQLQDQPELNVLAQDEAAWYQALKSNLLKLTATIAPDYDQKYDDGHFATHCYLDFERRQLARVIDGLAHQGVAVDLGCATGQIALSLASQFEKVTGYDLSPDMIKQAQVKRDQQGLANVDLAVTDAEETLALPDSSVSLIVMNMGTASDIKDIDKLMAEVERILRPEGRAFLSFYNADAMLYRTGFLPWPTGLAAEINLQKHCLDVHIAGHSRPYSIYARPYKVEEVRSLFNASLALEQLFTFPTICSILPPYIFEDATMRQTVSELDERIADSNLGAYIIAVAKKT